MDKSHPNSSKLVFFIVWFLYVALFSFLTTVLRENGYINYEPAYITNHINTLFYDGELVKNFFLSYPLLTNLISYPFSIFNAEDAPFFASIFYSSLFFTIVVTKVREHKGKIFSFLLFVYFLCSPISIYMATSGTSLYAFFILYFYIFYLLFFYIKKFTTYHLAILSIVLSTAVFLNYKILWILLILFFYIFIFTIYKIKGLRYSNIIIRYIKITRHKSLRRKFRGHFFSMIFIIGFLPLSILLLYFTINYLIGNEALYFYTNSESRWNAIKPFNMINLDDLNILKNNAINDFSFIKIIFYLIPIYLFEVCSYYKEGLKVFIMLIVPAVLFTLLKESSTDYMNLSYYSIIVAAAIASYTTNQNKLLKKLKSKYVIYSLIFIGGIIGEYFYIHNSHFTSEKIYANSVLNNVHHKILNQYKNGGRFLAMNTEKESRILCDKSIFYPIITYNKKHNYFIQNSSKDFRKTLSNPKKNCDYIIISNKTSYNYKFDNVNKKLFERNLKLNQYSTKIIYFSKDFKILKILK